MDLCKRQLTHHIFQVVANYHIYTVGTENIKIIHEHYAGGEGDKWFWMIEYEDGRLTDVFNPIEVLWKSNNDEHHS